MFLIYPRTSLFPKHFIISFFCDPKLITMSILLNCSQSFEKKPSKLQVLCACICLEIIFRFLSRDFISVGYNEWYKNSSNKVDTNTLALEDIIAGKKTLIPCLQSFQSFFLSLCSTSRRFFTLSFS